MVVTIVLSLVLALGQEEAEMTLPQMSPRLDEAHSRPPSGLLRPPVSHHDNSFLFCVGLVVLCGANALSELGAGDARARRIGRA